jgi:nitrate/nitrite-specific signal transduction histidine kinase
VSESSSMVPAKPAPAPAGGQRRGVPKRGLRAKIIGWFLVPIAVILAAVAVLVFTASQRVTQELVFERNQGRTQLLAHQLSSELSVYGQTLRTAAVAVPDPTADGPAFYNPPAAVTELLASDWPVGALELFDGGALLLDSEGVILAATRSLQNQVGQRLSLPDLNPEALGYSDIHFSSAGGMDCIYLVQPMPEAIDGPGSEGARSEAARSDAGGSIVGLFRAERGATRGSAFYRRLWDLYIGRRLSSETAETAYLVDGNGRVIFHPDTFLIGEDFSALEPVQQALAGTTGAVRTRDISGRDIVAGFAPVPRTSWALVTEEPWAEIEQTSNPYLRLMIGLLVLGVAVPVLTVALGVGRITRPLETLTQAARDVASGNFGQRMEVRTGDELETLGDQFNTMAAELQASYATLEQRVADRTKELATLNTIATVVSRSLELGAIMEAALDATLDATSIEAGAAFRLQDGRLQLMAHRGFSPGFIEEVTSLPLALSLAAEAAAAMQPVVRPVAGYPEGALRRILEAEGALTVIVVPLIAKDAILGTLNLATRDLRTLTPETSALLAAIGRQAGLAVENACLYEQAETAAAAAERNRLARELHDAISQSLFTASLIADVMPQLWERHPEEARRQLEVLRRLTRGAQAEMRALLLELRPTALVEAGLDTLLSHLVHAVAARADLEASVEVLQLPPLPVDVKIALYRIVQEALNNVVKHAQCTRVTVTVHAPEVGAGIEVHVCDDGQGFDPGDVPADHFGLLTMRERASAIGARLDLATAPGKGTCVSVMWMDEHAQEDL